MLGTMENENERKLDKVTYIGISKQMLGRSRNATVSTRLQFAAPFRLRSILMCSQRRACANQMLIRQ